MFKLIGAIIIIMATTWTGFTAAKFYEARTEQLRQLKGALQTLEAEIMFAHRPLHEAALQIGNQLAKPLSSFFFHFSNALSTSETTVNDAWNNSLKTVWPKTALKKREYEIMKQFGTTLGKHDRHSQQKQIGLTIQHLEIEQLNAAEQQKKYEKMVRSLGFLSGLLLVILFL